MIPRKHAPSDKNYTLLKNKKKMGKKINDLIQNFERK